MISQDFNRFYCVLTTLRMGNYAVYFCIKLFPELLSQVAEEEERKIKVVDRLFSDEDNLYAYVDLYQQWLCEFWQQMPLESQKRKYKDLFGIVE